MLHACYHGADRFLDSEPASQLARLPVCHPEGWSHCFSNPQRCVSPPPSLLFLSLFNCSLPPLLSLPFQKGGKRPARLGKIKREREIIRQNAFDGNMIMFPVSPAATVAADCFWDHCPDVWVWAFVLGFFFQSHYSAQHATQSFWLMCLAQRLGAASHWRWTAGAWCFF